MNSEQQTYTEQPAGPGHDIGGASHFEWWQFVLVPICLGFFLLVRELAKVWADVRKHNRRRRELLDDYKPDIGDKTLLRELTKRIKPDDEE